MKKNNAYWKERFVQLEQGQFYTAMGEYQHVQRFFNQAQKELQDEIELWYARLANNNGVSMSEARKLLKGKKLDEFKWTVEQYIQYGQDNAMNNRWLKELENASARYHISHLEALQIQTKQAIEKCYASYGLTATNAIGEAYKSALYKTAYTIQRGFGVGADIAEVDQRKLEALLAKPWAVDGKNFSERIWDNKEKLVNELHQSLSRNIMTGGDPKQVIDELAKKMNTSKANAGRLIMTESAYFSSLAEKNELADLGVEEYEIVATLDDRTSDICQGMDGQIFKVKDFQPGVNAPPFHVNCRSTTVPYFSDNFDLGERATRDKDGNTITVPASMKYPEWKKQFVKEDSAPAVKNNTKANIVSNIEEAKKALVERVGFIEIEESFNLIDCDLAIENTNQLLKLENKFGAIHLSKGSICSVNSRNANAYVSRQVLIPSNQKLSLCPSSYSNRAKLIESKRYSVEIGWSMPMALTDEELVIGIVTHEYGHILQNILVESAMKNAGWTAKSPNAFADYTKRTQKAVFKWYFDVDKKVRKQHFNEIVTIAKKRTPKFNLKDNLSEYGYTNYAEFFAEVFANSQLSKPNELGDAMNIWLKEKGLIKNDAG